MSKISSLSLIVLSIVFSVLFSCTSELRYEVLSADDIVISFYEEGSGKPALVFVHGWSCDKDYWKYQVPYFSKNFKVVTIDLAGHGKSGLERESWTMEAFGRDVNAVLDQLEIEQAILAGHSMGGAVILEAARQSPDRIIGLVGVDTYHEIESKYTAKQIDNFISAFKTDFAATTKNFVRGMFTPDADTALVNHIANDMSSAPPEVGPFAMEAYFKYDHAGTLKELNIPIVSINCDLWPTNVEAAKRHASSFEIKIMPGIGHFVMLEDPDNFNQLLEETVNEMVNK